LPDEIRYAVGRWRLDGHRRHVWQVGVGKFAAIISIVAHEPKSADQYRELLRNTQS
jgi:hypothetical protein